MQNPFPGLASQAQSFIFGAGTDTPTYESLKRKREQINALAEAASQGGMPRNGWEGATQTAQILASKFGDRRLAPKEDAERERAIGELTSLMGGGFTGQGGFSGTPETMSSRSAPTGGGNLDALLGGIAQTESGGRYDAMGPEVKGDRAYGKYQVMGANIPAWTRETLGQELDPQTFLKNPEAQEAVARAKLGSYMDKHGNWQDAASMWFSGRPMQEAGNASDGFNTVPEYISKVAGAMGQPATMSSQGGGQAPDMGKIAQIAELLSNPYLPEGQRMVAGAFIQNELGKLAGPEQMTPYQAAQLGLEREKMGQAMDIARAGATNVTVEGDSRPEIGTIPAGYEAIQTDSGGWTMAPIPGGPVDLEMQQAANKAAAVDEADAQSGDIVLDEVGRALSLLDETDNRAAGTFGTIRSLGGAIAEAPQSRLDGYLQTVMNNVAFDKLSQMRQNSPTGGAVGALTDKEREAIGSLKGKLNARGDAGDLRYNLERLRELYLDAVHGTEAQRAEALSQGKITPEQNAQVQALYGQGAGIPQAAQDAGIDPDVWQYLSPEERALWK